VDSQRSSDLVAGTRTTRNSWSTRCLPVTVSSRVVANMGQKGRRRRAIRYRVPVSRSDVSFINRDTCCSNDLLSVVARSVGV